MRKGRERALLHWLYNRNANMSNQRTARQVIMFRAMQNAITTLNARNGYCISSSEALRALAMPGVCASSPPPLVRSATL